MATRLLQIWLGAGLKADGGGLVVYFKKKQKQKRQTHRNTNVHWLFANTRVRHCFATMVIEHAW